MKTLLDAPMVEWDRIVSAMNTADRFETERQLSALAVRYARASAYLGRRLNGGLHADAVKRQNQVARRTRQALGYTYADDKITF